MGTLGYTQREEIVELAQTPVDLARAAATQHEISQIRRAVVLDFLGGMTLRELERDFPGYIRDRFDSPGRDAALDFWSNPYLLDVRREEIEIYSSGPDGWADTVDDVWVVVTNSQLGI